jgi:hypothetical protein
VIEGHGVRLQVKELQKKTASDFDFLDNPNSQAKVLKAASNKVGIVKGVYIG